MRSIDEMKFSVERAVLDIGVKIVFLIVGGSTTQRLALSRKGGGS